MRTRMGRTVGPCLTRVDDQPVRPDEHRGGGQDDSEHVSQPPEPEHDQSAEA